MNKKNVSWSKVYWSRWQMMADVVLDLFYSINYNAVSILLKVVA